MDGMLPPLEPELSRLPTVATVNFLPDTLTGGYVAYLEQGLVAEIALAVGRGIA